VIVRSIEAEGEGEMTRRLPDSLARFSTPAIGSGDPVLQTLPIGPFA